MVTIEELYWDKEKKYLLMKLDVDNKEDVLNQMGGKLESTGYVKDSFTQAVCKREIVFPTGLPMKGVGIAIPHTDSEHVNEKSIAVGILKKPVVFQVMGSTDEFVDVQLVFMLAIKDPNAQLEMLEKLIENCQNEETLYTLRDCTDLNVVKEIISNLL